MQHTGAKEGATGTGGALLVCARHTRSGKLWCVMHKGLLGARATHADIHVLFSSCMSPRSTVASDRQDYCPFLDHKDDGNDEVAGNDGDDEDVGDDEDEDEENDDEDDDDDGDDMTMKTEKTAA